MGALAAETEIADLSLDQLMQIEVQSVSKYAQPLDKVPAIVTVISGEDFKRYGWRTVADMLRTIPGFYVSNAQRAYPMVGVSGLASPQIFNEDILVMLDGHRMNENMYDEGLLGDDSIFDVDLIDHVEIIRGPASSVYGGNALLGVINVITKTGKDFKGGEIFVALGSGKDRTGRASYGMTLDNGGDFFISANRRTIDGFSIPLDNVTTVAKNVDGLTRNSFLAKLRLDGIELEAGSYNRIKNTPIGIAKIQVNDPGNFENDAHSFVDIKTKKSLSDKSDFSIRLFYDVDPQHWGLVYPDTPAAPQSGYSQSVGLDLQLVYMSFSGHKIIYGLEAVDRYVANYSIVFLNDRSSTTFNDTRRKYGLFAQDEIELNPSLALTVGGRCDNNGIISGICSPRLALLKSTEELGVFKVLYGSAFRSPNLYERLPSTDATSTSDKSLHSNIETERIKSFGLSWDNPAQSSLRVHADIYRYSMNQLIGYNLDPFNGGAYANLGDVEAYGGVFSVEKNWTADLSAKLSYSYSHARLFNSQILDNSPDHIIQANLRFPLTTHWSGGYELQYLDGRLAQGSNADGSALISKMLPSQWVNNLSVKFSASKSSPEWSFSIYNLFNRTLVDPADDGYTTNRLFVQQNSREYRASVLIPF